MEVDGQEKPAAPAEPAYKLEKKTRTVKQEVPVKGAGLEIPESEVRRTRQSGVQYDVVQYASFKFYSPTAYDSPLQSRTV